MQNQTNLNVLPQFLFSFPSSIPFQFKDATFFLCEGICDVEPEVCDFIGFLSYEVIPSVSVQQTVLDMSNSREWNEATGKLETSFESVEDIKKSEMECKKNKKLCKNHFVKPQKIQNVVLRTNCVDCLDRTNVAQFAYGLVALGYQLHALGIIRTPEVDSLDESLVSKTTEVYKAMGDALAWKYGGSGARCKIFSEKSGEWRPAIQLKEMINTLQCFFINVCMDAKRQKAINLLLGYLRPGGDQLAQMEMGSHDSYDVGAPDWYIPTLTLDGTSVVVVDNRVVNDLESWWCKNCFFGMLGFHSSSQLSYMTAMRSFPLMWTRPFEASLQLKGNLVLEELRRNKAKQPLPGYCNVFKNCLLQPTKYRVACSSDWPARGSGLLNE